MNVPASSSSDRILNVEQPSRHLHDLVDLAVGARLVDREFVLVIAVVVASPI